MATSRDHNRDRPVRDLARRQHGVVSREQVLRLGFTPSAIKHRCRAGRWLSIHRGVFAVGDVGLSRRGCWMAAVLAGGASALLSHESAAELWELRPHRSGPTEISLMTPSKRRIHGVVIHRRTVLGAEDRRARHGIPVTSPTRTLADLATRLPAAEVEAAVNEADTLDLVSVEQLRQSLERIRGQDGVSRLLAIISPETFRRTDSELERRFLGQMRRAGIPLPETGVRLEGWRVDFCWPAFGLVVETDGLRYHRTPTQQERDRRRDQDLTAAGLTVLRFTYRQVSFEGEHVVAVLREVMTRSWRRRASA